MEEVVNLDIYELDDLLSRLDNEGNASNTSKAILGKLKMAKLQLVTKELTQGDTPQITDSWLKEAVVNLEPDSLSIPLIYKQLGLLVDLFYEEPDKRSNLTTRFVELYSRLNADQQQAVAIMLKLPWNFKDTLWSISNKY